MFQDEAPAAAAASAMEPCRTPWIPATPDDPDIEEDCGRAWKTKVHIIFYLIIIRYLVEANLVLKHIFKLAVAGFVQSQ